MAETRITANPYDIEAWTLLLKENQLKPIDEARNFYEKLVDTFPLSGRFWKLYIDHEMKFRNHDKVEKLFGRTLTKVLHIDLWKCYLNYIKETKGGLNNFREKMGKAFEFALEHIGIDNQSYSIWADYVHFLKSVEACGSYAENQKITATRKIYQRGIATPMANIENLWKEYVAFEQSINPIIAEKMTSERGKEYMNARRVAKEYESLTRGLNRNQPAIPPSTSPEESKQLDLWRKYIQWEKTNPLKTEDPSVVVKRVVFAYEQCLLCLGHHPEVWYEYASYLEEQGSATDKTEANKKYQDDAAAVYEKAVTGLMKNNILIHFAYADFEEGRNKKTKATEIYDRILSVPNIDPTLVYIQFMRFARRSEGIKQARLVFKKAREDNRSKHHVYTAAAYMEFYSQKDRSVASKIFELGLKKFPSEVDFILSYIDFLRNANEENNTRVLFERVITSGSLEPDKSIEVWNKFLEFEANIGDLASITKVEKRRTLAFEKTSCKPRSDTSWLIDRYRFNDLFPCSLSELRAIGYDVTKSLATSSAASVLLSQSLMNGVSGKTKSDSKNRDAFGSNRKLFTRPDFTQMIPFKPVGPRHHPAQGVLIPVLGGVFRYPPAVANLLSNLPPPSCFRGPFVSLDELIGILMTNPLIDRRPQKPEGIPNGVKYFDTAIKASQGRGSPTNNSTGDTRGNNKRAGGPIIDDDDENAGDGDNSNSGFSNDIYRNRKIKAAKPSSS